MVLRLDLRFLSTTFNLKVKEIRFCDLCLFLNVLKDGLPNDCDFWLSVPLLSDEIPKFWEYWLSVRPMVDAYDQGFT